MEFDRITAQRGLKSPEASGAQLRQCSFDLWLQVADDLCAWLVRYN